jgi:2-polyprenyl-3-methyl-5-hydroxy-6-metoxy-1,4-benzoquinol methylase
VYLLPKEDIRVAQCSACKLRFVADEFSPAELLEYYGNDAADYYHMSARMAEKSKHVKRALELEEIASVYLRHVSTPRHLDVGCSVGSLLHQTQSRGFEPHGIDMSDKAVSYAQQLYGLKIHQGTLETFQSDQRHHAVTLFDVIEHVRKPREILLKCNGLLEPGGLLGLETPNGDSAFDHMADRAYHVGFRKAARQFLRLRYSKAHLQIFTPEQLGRILEETGFELLRISVVNELSWPYEFYLSSLGIPRRAALLGSRLLQLVRILGLFPRTKIVAWAHKP